MKTVIYQSYRTTNVPNWINSCMQSVKVWADLNAFDYRFYDDVFFEYAPDWFRDKANHEICPITDLARLVAAKQLLSEGYQRTIWVDADMLVFDPSNLSIDLHQDFTFCHEIWLYTDSNDGNQIIHRVNNSMTVFCANNVHLDFFIDAALRIGKYSTSIGKLDIGTNFLSTLRSILPFPLLENVGILSPVLMNEIYLDKPNRLLNYAHALRLPLACANLCASLQNQNIQGVFVDSAIYDNVVKRLLVTQGNVINQHRK
jgi:hypothetical protein